ncbi:MAG: hypothetical protein H2069_07585 [Legionella sp.]|nr:hypothetical protein [Legionella sp.]
MKSSIEINHPASSTYLITDRKPKFDKNPTPSSNGFFAAAPVKSDVSHSKTNDLYDLQPIDYVIDGFSKGRLYDFGKTLKKFGITFDADVTKLAYILGGLTGTKIDDKGIYHPCSCNGPHHAFIVAKFSLLVVSEMLAHEEMCQKINNILDTLPTEARDFLRNNDYENYKKLIQVIGLLHDSGRPRDGIDRWDRTSQKNVVSTINHLMNTTALSQESVTQIIAQIKVGIENKDSLQLQDDTGFLFGVPVGAGDSLHSGHAFHGGLWDSRSYNPDYVCLYKRYPSFRESFKKIINEIAQFVPTATAENGGLLAAVKKYLTWNENDGDGCCIIKPNFVEQIEEEFMSLNADQYPIMSKHFGSKGLTADDRAECLSLSKIML